MPRIELRHVSKNFGKIIALEDINLYIEDGQYVCVLGPTGSGKTTLLKVIAGLLPADRGEVYIDGILSNDVPPERRGASYMSQDYALFPHMTTWKNIAYGLIVRGAKREDVAAEVEEMLEIIKLKGWGQAYPQQLSGGMQQRVALARCIITGSKILLLDEPLGALDARLRLELRGELKRLARDFHLTVIHVTHDQAEATAVGDKIVLLRDGRIEQIGSPEEIYFRPRTIFAANFVGEKNILEGVVKEVRGNIVTIDIGDGLEISAFNDGFNRGELVVLAIRCEDVFPFVIDEQEVNRLSGVVKDVRLLGTSCRYTIEMKGKVLHSHMPSRLAFQNPIDVNSIIPLSIRSKDVALFKYPERGLATELEVI